MGSGPDTTAMEMIRVLLVDDQSGVRAGLKMALSLETDIDVVGEAGDGPEALAETALRRPDVVVLDYEMPGMDGPAVIEALKRSGWDGAVVMLSLHDDAAHRSNAASAGAYAFVSKSEPCERLVDQIRAAVN
jgi:DNA-binding NarL/FixJ family response regulator